MKRRPIRSRSLSIPAEAEENPILEYWEAMNNGLTVSKKIYMVYQKLVKDIKDAECVWEFNLRRAEHAILFIEHFCRQSKGRFGGHPIQLELWQRAMIAAMFGFVGDDGFRRFQEVILMVARKNGKSTLSAAVGLYLMIADQEPGAEIYAVATKKDQAKIIWQESKSMVKKSPDLLKKISCLVGELKSDFNDSTFKPLGADSETLDGLNVHGALMDEMHAWKDTNLYDVVNDGKTSRQQPMTFITTTAGTVRDGIFDLKYEQIEKVIDSYTGICMDDRILPLIYELDERAEWTRPECWIKANPGLGTIKSMEQLQDKVKRAKLNPLLVKNLVCKDFNIRETTATAFLTYEEVLNTETFDLKELAPRYCVGGADLAETTDLTCAGFIFRIPGSEKIYVHPMFFIPEDVFFQRINEDKVPYDIWKKQGYLRTVPGNKMHPKFITQWFREVLQENDIYMTWLGYDAWAAAYWVEEMETLIGPAGMEKVRQGKQTLSTPMKELKADLVAKKIVYNNNPIMKWCMTNVNVDIDKNNNIQPCKGRNQRARIDGFAMLLDAYVVYCNHKDEYLSDIGIVEESAKERIEK